jgi:hypothetical protein
LDAVLVDCWGVNFIVGEITPLLQSGKEAFLGVIGGAGLDRPLSVKAIHRNLRPEEVGDWC